MGSVALSEIERGLLLWVPQLVACCRELQQRIQIGLLAMIWRPISGLVNVAGIRTGKLK